MYLEVSGVKKSYGDEEYLETCLKVYKQLSLDAVGKAIAEKEQWTEIDA